jgi:hypothetical protein
MTSQAQAVSGASAAHVATAVIHSGVHFVPNGAAAKAVASAAAKSEAFAKEGSEPVIVHDISSQIRSRIALDLTAAFRSRKNEEIRTMNIFQMITSRYGVKDRYEICINSLRGRCEGPCKRLHVDLIRCVDNRTIQLYSQTYQALQAKAKSFGKNVCMNNIRQHCHDPKCDRYHAVAGYVNKVAATSGMASHPEMSLGAEATNFSAAAGSAGNAGGGAVAAAEYREKLAEQERYQAMVAAYLKAQRQHAASNGSGAQYQQPAATSQSYNKKGTAVQHQYYAESGAVYQVPMYGRHMVYQAPVHRAQVYRQPPEPFLSPAPPLPDSTVEAAPRRTTFTLTEKPNIPKGELQVTRGSAFNKPQAGAQVL